MTTQPLVTTDWLAANLNDPRIRIVDIRGHVAPPTDPLPHYYNHRADYVKGHIPGAVFVDWVHEITNPDDPQHAKIAPPERYEAAMRRHGISADTQVIAYDDAQGMFAARLWFTLNYYGHANVAVLDGGWPKWMLENKPVTAVVPEVAPGQFVARPYPEWIAFIDEVAQIASHKQVAKLIDVRTVAEFNGNASRAKRKGHIPGAVNLTRTTLNTPEGSMLPPEKLREIFAQAGVNESEETVVYCNGGVSASYGLLALRRAGFDKSRVYDGSWKEWGNDETTDIEQ